LKKEGSFFYFPLAPQPFFLLLLLFTRWAAKTLPLTCGWSSYPKRGGGKLYFFFERERDCESAGLPYIGRFVIIIFLESS
jgi:hypothetical protein